LTPPKPTITFAGLFPKVAFSLCALVVLFSCLFHISAPNLLYQIKASYSFRYINPVYVGLVNGTNLHTFLFKIIIGLSLLLALLNISRRRRLTSSLSTGFQYFSQFLLTASWITWFFIVIRLLLKVTWVTWCFIIILQTYNDTLLLWEDVPKIAGKTVTQKQSRKHLLAFDFAQECRQKFPGRHRCQFFTDGDLTTDPAMFHHRKLAYFLYPVIDIRGVHPERPLDCLIFYEKADAAKLIPPGFKIKVKMSSSTLLAVQESPTP
jgi:hypothetical protein